MAINFPNTPALNETFTEGNTTWKWDGTAWNVVSGTVARNIFTNFTADTGTVAPNQADDTLTVEGGSNITTSITGKVLTITGSGGGLTQNVFDTITADEGSTSAASINDTLNILGGTNISTAIATDTDNVTINMNAFGIDFLSDVDTTSSAPTTGQVLKWNGTNWAPGADATTGGGGTDADTLDGFDSAYFLNYNNLSNTPSVVALDSFSVGIENTPSGNGAISYNDSTGEFKFTPPTAAGIGALESFTETNDLSTAVTWADVPDANITQSSVTQHQAALTITESQISDFGTYLTGIGSLSIDALSDVDTTTTAPTNDQVLAWDGANWVPADPAAGGGGGDVNQNAFSIFAVAGQNNVEADTTTDTVTFSAGAGISITTTDSTDTITITNTATPVTTFGQLSDIAQAGIDVQNVYEHAIATLRMGNVGITAYTIDSHYSGNNPTITVITGTTIAFDLSDISGHPFELQDNTLTALTSNLVHVDASGNVSTNSSAQGKSDGVLYWRVPDSIPNNSSYTYQCQSHAGMFGTITVKNL
jgi:plastocyanin